MSLYQAHFELDASPFSIAPDPRYLYMSERHREALAHLQWGLSSEGGFVLLTGEVGTGKTTLSRCLLERIPEDTRIAFVINPRVTVTELLATVCEELGIEVPPGDGESVKRLVDHINAFLLDAHAAGRRVVLVIDEAQNLSVDVLEQIRLLTNLETNERKLLQVILLGQPELATLLQAPELRQLAQRITARYHLTPLSADELAALVHHRLGVAGARRNPFAPAALRALHAFSRGIPRIANVIADRALLGAYGQGRENVSAAIVRQAAQEVLGDQARTGTRVWRAVAALVCALLVATAVTLAWPRLLPAGSTTAAAAADVQADARGPASDLPSAGGAPNPSPGAATSGAMSARMPDGGVPEPAPSEDAGNATSGDQQTRTSDASATRTAAASANSSGSASDPRPPALDPEPAPTGASASEPQALRALWDVSEDASLRGATDVLLEAWYAPIELPPDQGACEGVGAAGLRCEALQGDWGTLIAADRPAMLEIWREGDGSPRWLALLAAGDEDLTIDAGDGAIRMTRDRIDTYWRGRAIVLWQMPPGYARPSRLGDEDETSAWLAERIALADGEDPIDGRAFDAALDARVRRFQMAVGLRPDGIVGPRTWMRLNDTTGLGAPTLTPR